VEHCKRSWTPPSPPTCVGARKRKLRGRLQTGSLTVVQRFGSSLNLNVHFHVIGMDGVYEAAPDGRLLFPSRSPFTGS
jgi:hypothetical protein